MDAPRDEAPTDALAAVYCHTCKQVVEAASIRHAEHEKGDLKEFLEMGKGKVPDASSFPDVQAQVDKKLEELQPQLLRAQEYLAILEWGVSVDRSEENLSKIRESNKILVEDVCKCVDTKVGETTNETLKEALESSLSVFKGFDIEVDMEILQKSLEELEKEKEDVSEKVMWLPRQIKQLECVKEALARGEFDEESNNCITFLRDAELITFECYEEPTPDNFSAFKEIETVFSIDEVMNSELINVRMGIQVSKPIPVEMGLWKPDYGYYVSVSHQGIISIGGYDNGEFKYKLQFINLNTKTEVKTLMKYFTNISYYDDKAIFMTEREHLREGTIEDIFTKPAALPLTEIVSTVELGACPYDPLLNKRRVLYYTTRDFKLFEYNVDTKVNNQIGTEDIYGSLLSCSGIELGIKCIFINNNDNKRVYSLNNDDTITKLSTEDNQVLPSTVFPSYSEPKDLSRAAYLICNYMHYKGSVCINYPIYLKNGYSIVRIYKDIFLYFDDRNDQWVLSRIIVP